MPKKDKCVCASPAASDHFFPTPGKYGTNCECGSKQVLYAQLEVEEQLPPKIEIRLDVESKTMDHRGGPGDDHYAKLSVQPMDVVDAWSPHWSSDISYYLGEVVHMIARAGTKGQTEYDLKKAQWLLKQAVRIETHR